MAEICLTDLIDVSILQQIQDGFSRYTGMAALTTDAEGIPVTKGSGFTDFCTNLTRKSKLGCKRCEECDKMGALQTLHSGKPSVYYCHAGLLDYAAPIMVEDRFVGSFIGGQVRTSDIDEDVMWKKALEMGIHPKVYIEAARKTALLEKKDVEKAAEFLAEIAKVLSEMAYRNYSALKYSHKMEHAARSQSVFIMNMSLNMQKSIKEWMSIAKQAAKSKDRDVMGNAIKDMLNAGREVLSTADDAIAYIQMAGGKVELTETEYSIRDLLQQVTKGVRSFVGDKDIQFKIEIDENVPGYMLGDSGRIGQIVNRLLQNSIYFMEKGEIVVRVSCHKASYATMLVLSVQDIGRGMDEDTLKIVREYFQDGRTYLKDGEEGDGFGLSIVNLLTRQLSGKMEIYSEENMGSTFIISLPQLEIKGGDADVI